MTLGESLGDSIGTTEEKATNSNPAEQDPDPEDLTTTPVKLENINCDHTECLPLLLGDRHEFFNHFAGESLVFIIIKLLQFPASKTVIPCFSISILGRIQW